MKWIKRLLAFSVICLLPTLGHAQFGSFGKKPDTKKPSTSATKKSSTTKSSSKSSTFGSLLKGKTGPRTPADKELLTYVKSTTKRITSTQKKKLHAILARGSQAELEKIDGIGEVKAKTIRSARPIVSVEDLANVSGFGKKTYGGVITWAKKEL